MSVCVFSGNVLYEGVFCIFVKCVCVCVCGSTLICVRVCVSQADFAEEKECVYDHIICPNSGQELLFVLSFLCQIQWYKSN